MGNESSSQQPPSIWTLARDGNPGVLRNTLDRIAKLPSAEKSLYMDWQDKSNERTAVAMAALMGKTECVKILLISGADSNRVGRDDMGPLHLAVKINDVAITNLLLKAT